MRTEKQDALRAYKKAGRWIIRIHGPWLDLNEAFHLGLAKDGVFEIETTEDNGNMKEAECNTYIKFYCSILAQVPNFKKTLEEFRDDYESIMELITLYQAHNVPPIPRDETGQGFNHVSTTHALCPHAYIYAFGNDEIFLEQITSGKVEVTINEFPNFLYDEGKAEELLEENLNVWNAEKGLLRSPLCLWSYKCIFMGNRFSEVTDKKKKLAISKINGLVQVTPSTIAYAMAQARFALSSCEEWGAEDGQFNLRQFYNAIVELFEQEGDKWVAEMLAWWNQKIFPDNLGMKGCDGDKGDAPPNFNSSRLKARQARLERAAR